MKRELLKQEKCKIKQRAFSDNTPNGFTINDSAGQPMESLKAKYTGCKIFAEVNNEK